MRSPPLHQLQAAIEKLASVVDLPPPRLRGPETADGGLLIETLGVHFERT